MIWVFSRNNETATRTPPKKFKGPCSPKRHCVLHWILHRRKIRNSSNQNAGTISKQEHKRAMSFGWTWAFNRDKKGKKGYENQTYHKHTHNHNHKKMAHDFHMIVSIGSFVVNVFFCRHSHNDTRNINILYLWLCMIMTITWPVATSSQVWHLSTVGICLLNNLSFEKLRLAFAAKKRQTAGVCLIQHCENFFI